MLVAYIFVYPFFSMNLHSVTLDLGSCQNNDLINIIHAYNTKSIGHIQLNLKVINKKSNINYMFILCKIARTIIILYMTFKTV